MLKDKEADHEVSVQSSYQALEAFKRRGLALDMAGVMTFQNHDRYVQKLFAHLNREPPQGYTRCLVSQLIAADKLVWSKNIEVNTKPRPDVAGVLALDTKLIEALEGYEVSFSLLPLPAKGIRTFEASLVISSAPASAETPGCQKWKERKRFMVYGHAAKGKGKTKYEQRIPQAIRDAGGVANNCDGDPVCFDYSLGSVRPRLQTEPGVIKVTMCVPSALVSMPCQITRRPDYLARPRKGLEVLLKFHMCIRTSSHPTSVCCRDLCWIRQSDFGAPEAGHVFIIRCRSSCAKACR